MNKLLNIKEIVDKKFMMKNYRKNILQKPQKNINTI